MKFPRIAKAVAFDGPEFESADGAINLSLAHMETLESHMEAQEGLITAAEQKIVTAEGKAALLKSELATTKEALEEQTTLVSQLTVQLEAAKKAPVDKAAVKSTGSEAVVTEEKKHAGPSGYRKSQKKD